MFAALPYDEQTHYDTAELWWTAHGWKSWPPADQLRTGVVVTFDNKPIAMGWLYRTDGPACWLHWMVCDRYAPRRMRSTALDHLIDQCEAVAQGWGYKQIWACTQIRRSMKRYKDHGFLMTDKHTTLFVKGL